MKEQAKLLNVSELTSWHLLIERAIEVKAHAYAPYSHFQVGAAILGIDNGIYVGCNVENASYGGSICAERTAAASMVSAGCVVIHKLVIISDASYPAFACGICRQFLSEFGASFEVLTLEKTAQQGCLLQFGELMPYSFLKGSLQ